MIKQFHIFFLILVSFSLSLRGQVTFPEYTLPLVKIESIGLPILDEPKITAKLKIIDNGPGAVNKPDDFPNGYDGFIGIEKRGQSSQFFFEKVGYGFETRLADGSNNNVELLGLPKENDWVLHGPFSDKTLIRNALAYSIGAQLMEYAPRYRFVELIINSDYKGVYLLVEKIKRDNDRVDIANLKPEDNSGDQLTGGYILKIDKTDSAEEGFFSDYPPLNNQGGQQTMFTYHDPKPSEITNPQKAYIKNWMGDFEDALKGPDYHDPISGYRAYIDESSFVNYFLVNEVTRNPDAYRISTYMYKDRDSLDGKLHMGPVWDYNLGFGNVNFCIGPNTTGWVKDYNYTCPQDGWLVPFWWDRLTKDTTFGVQVRDRWNELRQNELSNLTIKNLINEMQAELGTAIERNFIRWPIMNENVWPNPEARGSYDAEIEALRDWLLSRMAWMDGAVQNLARPVYNQQAYFEPIIFPNPSEGELWLKFYAPAGQKVRLRIYDSLGKLIQQETYSDYLNGENVVKISPRYWGHGTYFYAIWYDFVFKAGGVLQGL